MTVLSVFMEDGRPDTGLKCKEKSLTQQHMANDCDINQIVKRFEQSGLLTHVSDKVARYGDFTDVPDYLASCNIVAEANSLFMALPAEIRERFDNDPAGLMAFLGDPKNREEAVKLGILEPKKVSGDSPDSGSSEVLKSKDKAVGG